MATNDARMSIRINYDIEKAKKKAEEFNVKVNSNKKELDNLNSVMAKVGRSSSLLFAGGAFGYGALISHVAKVRGEFQQLEIAFSTMLRSEEKANKLMGELVETAAKTPFDLQGVASGAKNLLAYGFAADQVNTTLISLGDVAAGLSQPLGDIVYLYGTLKASGRVTNIDIRQFANRGIPIYEELARVMGVSEKKINSLVASGKVGFPQIEQAFKNMTGAGGKFHNLMEAQSKSITGQISNLKDAIDVMMNNIGKNQQGIISGSISVVSSLVENYEKVGKILASLVATYGAYRTALILTSVTTKGVSVSMWAHYNVLVVVEKAQKLLNATMLANPYVALAVGVTALVGAMWAFHDSTTSAEKAQKRFNESQAEAKKKSDEHKQKVEELITTANNEASSTADRQSALRSLKSYYPNIFKAYDIEKLRLADILKLKKQIAEADYNRAKQDLGDRAEGAKARLANIQKQIKDSKKNVLFNQNTDYVLPYLREQEAIALKEVEKYKDVIRKNLDNEALSPDRLSKLTEAQLKAQIKAVDKLQEKLRSNKRKGGNGAEKGHLIGGVIEGSYSLSELDGIRSTLQSSLESMTKVYKTYAEEKKDALKDLKKTEEEYNAFIKKSATELKKWSKENGDKDPAEKRKELKEEIEAKKKALKDEFDIEKEKSTKPKEEAKDKSLEEQARRADAEFNINRKTERELRDIELSKSQSRIDGMNEGHVKILAQIELNKQKELEAIERAEQDRIKEYDDNAVSYPKEWQDVFDNQRNVANTKAEQETQRVNYDLIKKYQSYYDLRLEAERKFDEDISELQSQRLKATTDEEKAKIDRAIEEAGSQKGKALSALSFEELKSTDLWVEAWGNLEKQSTQTLDKMQSLLENSLGTQRLTVQETKQVKEAIEQIQSVKRGKDPFRAMSDSFKELVIGLRKGDTKATSESLYKMSKSAYAIGDVVDELGGGIAEIFGDKNGEIASAVEELQSLAKATGDFMSSASSFAKGDILGGIKGVVKGIGGIFSIRRKAKEASRKAESDVKAFYDNAIKGEREYMAMQRERARQEQKDNALTIAQYQKRIALLKEQSSLTQTDYDRVLRELQGESYVSGVRTKKTGFIFRKKKLVEELSGLNGKSYEDLELLYMQGKLKDRAKDLFEQLRKLREEGENISKALEDGAESWKQALSGITFESAQEALKSMLEDGKVDISETGKFMQDTFRRAIINSAVMKGVSGQLEALVKDIQDSVDNGTYDKRFDEFNKRFGDIGDTANKYVQPFMKFFENMGEAIEGSKKGFGAMSQEVGSELNGRFTSVQMASLNILEINKRMGIDVSELRRLSYITANDVTEIKDFTRASMNSLAKIEKHTSVLPIELPEINKRLRNIEGKL